MLTYYYRISDLHKTRNITAISVYTEGDKNFKPNKIEYVNFGTRILYEFNTYKVLDQKESKLKKSNNIFAFVTLAVLYSLKAKDNQKTKLKFKIELTRILIDKKYSNEDIEELFEFINLFLSFSNEKYDNLFYEELEKMPKTKERESLNSYDKFLIKKRNIEIIIKGYKKGFSNQDLSDLTGLSITKVQEIINNKTRQEEK